MKMLLTIGGLSFVIASIITLLIVRVVRQARRNEEARRKAEESRLKNEVYRRFERQEGAERQRRFEEKRCRAAEEKARVAAEQEAQRQADEEARRAAEEKARIAAEQVAQRQAEEEARRAVEEKARAAAEQVAQRQAEEEARRAVEEKARAAAKQEAQRQADEEARRAAEEKARIAAEQVAQRQAEEEANAAAKTRGSQSALRPIVQKPTAFRDRRGGRRTITSQVNDTPKPEQKVGVGMRQAEAKFRLAIDPIRRSILLSTVLARPEGFPESINVDPASGPTQAFDQARYDDIAAIWTPDLLGGEFRVRDESQQLEWLRSARAVHIFAATVGEPDFLSVSAAQLGSEHAIVCPEADVESIEALAIQAGSPALRRYPNFQGVPAGWSVLGGYFPSGALSSLQDLRFRPLDPGAEIRIVFIEGFEIRNAAFAQGHPPRVLIERMPPNCVVWIGSERAAISDDGGWQAPGWDKPGKHLVDVVPGPSQSYEIIADPAHGSGWETWTANPDLAPALVPDAAICGALVVCLQERMVVATEPASVVLALGARHHVKPLFLRPDKLAAVGVLPFAPAFLIVSSGRRRTEGKIVVLGNPETVQGSKREAVDMHWVAAVRAAAARRIPIYPATAAAKAVWNSAANAARRWRGGR